MAFFFVKKFVFLHGDIMTTFSIGAEVRTPDQKATHIRKNKHVPAVVYGKTQEPISLCMDSSEFLRLYRKAGESTIIDLKVGKIELEVLVHDTQKHPVTWDFTHVDFYAITRGEKLTTNIHITFVWDAPAVKEWAIVEELTREIEVKCLPRNLVDHFEVDISVLKEPGDVIRIEDMNIDEEKYEILTSEDAVIASATLPRAVVADEDEISEGEEWEETWDAEGEEWEGTWSEESSDTSESS